MDGGYLQMTMILFKDMDKLLTNKGCAIILSISCLGYFLLNLTVLRLAVTYAILNALCTTVVFAILLYIIRDIIEKRKIKEKASKEMKADIIDLGKDIDPEVCKRLEGKEVDGRCVVVETGVGEDGDIHLKVLKDRDTTTTG